MLVGEGSSKSKWPMRWRIAAVRPIAKSVFSRFLAADLSFVAGMAAAILAGLAAGEYHSRASHAAVPFPPPGIQEVCQSLRAFGVRTVAIPEETGAAGGYACSTPFARDPKSEWGNISLHATATAGAPAILSAVRLRGAYTNVQTERETANQMIVAANAVFARLHRTLPEEVRDAIAFRSPRDFSGDGIHVHAGQDCNLAESAGIDSCAFTISVALSPSSLSELAETDSESENVF